MLHVQELILNNENWEDILKKSPFCISVKHDVGHVIFNYNLFNSDLSNPVVKECRGLILNEKTFDPVCVPFFKFFNYGEEFADKIDWTTARVQTKIDGSIIKLWYDKLINDWRISTNGMINADAVETCSPHINENIRKSTFGALFRECAKRQNLDFSKLNKKYTYIFELTSIFNRQVIKYNKDMIWHIGTRDNTTLRELNVDIGVQKPQEFAFTTLQDVIDVANKFKDEQEGFVVVDGNWNRVKVKSPYYVATSHYFNDSIAMSKLIEVFLSGDYEEFLVYYPKYTPIIREMEAYIDEKCNEINNGLGPISELFTKKDVDRAYFYSIVKDKPWGDYAMKKFSAVKNPNYTVPYVKNYVLNKTSIYSDLKKHLRENGIREDLLVGK